MINDSIIGGTIGTLIFVSVLLWYMVALTLTSGNPPRGFHVAVRYITTAALGAIIALLSVLIATHISIGWD